jgi:hypothetical protein
MIGTKFGSLTRELGIPRPDDVPRIEGKSLKRDWFRRQPEKGRSTLHPWICPNCGLKLRATIKGEINSTHDDCGVKYIRAGDLDRTIYKSK